MESNGGRKERKIEVGEEVYGRGNGEDTGKHKNTEIFQKENNSFQ